MVQFGRLESFTTPLVRVKTDLLYTIFYWPGPGHFLAARPDLDISDILPAYPPDPPSPGACIRLGFAAKPRWIAMPTGLEIELNSGHRESIDQDRSKVEILVKLTLPNVSVGPAS